jgi:hypothetical protein
VKTMLGDGKMLCRVESRYTEKPEFKFTGDVMGPDKRGENSVSFYNPDWG